MIQPRILSYRVAGFLLAFGLLYFFSLMLTLYSKCVVDPSVVSYSQNGSSHILSSDSNHQNLQWRIKPIRPLREGSVLYLLGYFQKDEEVEFQRIFTAPCGDGILVFNVGPAPAYKPYQYELYEDAFMFSNNGGWCIFYRSYSGIQTSRYPLWNVQDMTELTISLGDVPKKISTRVVVPPGTKPFDHSDTNYAGGDYLIIRNGNFYNSIYYKLLKYEINSWSKEMSAEDVSARLSEWIATF